MYGKDNVFAGKHEACEHCTPYTPDQKRGLGLRHLFPRSCEARWEFLTKSLQYVFGTIVPIISLRAVMLTSLCLLNGRGFSLYRIVSLLNVKPLHGSFLSRFSCRHYWITRKVFRGDCPIIGTISWD